VLTQVFALRAVYASMLVKSNGWPVFFLPPLPGPAIIFLDCVEVKSVRMASQHTSIYGYNVGNSLTYYPLAAVPIVPGLDASAQVHQSFATFAPHRGDYVNAKLAARTSSVPPGEEAIYTSPFMSAFHEPNNPRKNISCSNATEAAQWGAAQCIDTETGLCVRPIAGTCPLGHVSLSLGANNNELPFWDSR